DAFVDYGRILVAEYASGGKTLTGVGFDRGVSHFAHYDLAGQSLRKSFLKSPLEFSRITSGFTYARPHPILGGVRPHLAIDYAAPVGTPVRAVADGVVVFAGWNGGNGIQVHLRHRSGYETQYNHLSRITDGLRTGGGGRQKQNNCNVGPPGLPPAAPSRGLRAPVQPPLADHRRAPDRRARAPEANHWQRRRHWARDRTAPRLPRREERHVRESARRAIHPRRADHSA